VKSAYSVKVSHESGTREFLVDASTYSVALNRAVSFDDRIAGGTIGEAIVVLARRVPTPVVPLKHREVRLVSDVKMRGPLRSIGTGLAG